jgi:chemotaxis response regulator CheB
MAKNILICDDAAFMRMMIKDILTKNGYNIAGEAENGAKAVQLVLVLCLLNCYLTVLPDQLRTLLKVL